jgi:hypothetical protein
MWTICHVQVGDERGMIAQLAHQPVVDGIATGHPAMKLIIGEPQRP